jgi:hypothetical protein
MLPTRRGDEMQPPVATDLSELLKQYGEACTQIALRCAVAVFDRSSKPDPLIEKVEQDKAGIASRITSLFASATEAGARIERDKIPEWRDIETAPKDGRDVLLWPCGIFGEPSPDIGYWDRDPEEECGQCWRTLDGERIEPLPTHWQKVPDPPEIESRGTAAIRERSEGGTQ